MSGAAAVRRSRPSTAALATLRDALSPGSIVCNVRRLRGGISAATHTVDLLAPTGERRRLVVRRFSPRSLGREAGLPARSWRTLSALEALRLPAPRPVWLDGDGAVFDSPTLVMTRMPGRGLLDPLDQESWLRQLAEALAALHRAPIDALDLSFLPGPGEQLAGSLRRWEVERQKLAQHPDSAALMAALAYWRGRLPVDAATLTHGDFWAGNTLWLRGRLSAVVDWDEAAVDHPGFDVGYCRLDLAMMAGRQAADGFLRAYEAAMGKAVSRLFVWDLAAAARALPDPAVWLPGYHDLGRRDVDAAGMRSRLRQFISDALDRASADERA